MRYDDARIIVLEDLSMTRHLMAWAETRTEKLSPMDAAMETLLQQVRRLAVEPSDELLDDVNRRLDYGVQRLSARLEEPVPANEMPHLAHIRLTRMNGLQAYLAGHEALLSGGDDLLAAAELARQHFERGRSLLNLAQGELEDLLERHPYEN